MTNITLWGAGTARTIRPIWLAEEMGLNYHLNPIGARTGETQTEEFTNLTRKQKIPFMQDGEVRLSESLAICRYLRDAYPSPSLPQPKTPAQKAKEDEWCCYVFGEIDETALYVMRRHADLTQIYGEAPQAVETCRAYLQRHFDVIDAHLANHKTLLDTGFGLADIMLVSCLDWAVYYKNALPAHIAAYRDRIAERAAYQKAMAINYAEMMEVINGSA